MAEYEEQKKLKPPLDLLIDELLSGTVHETAVGFVAFLRDNRLTPQWGAKNSYNVKFKSKRVCILKIAENTFEIRAATQYDDKFAGFFNAQSYGVKRFLLDGLTFCSACGTCKPGVDMEADGRVYKNLCLNPVVNILNPDAEYYEVAKQLILLRKEAIVGGIVPKTTYIAASKRNI